MRTFIALDIDPPIIKKIARLQEILRSQLPHLNWTDPAKIHLTIQFLGEIAEAQVAEISSRLDEIVRDSPAPAFEVAGVGAFPPHGKVNVVWVGIRDAAGALAKLHGRCESAMELLGFEKEDRRYNPHLTLARCRSPKDAEKIRKRLEQHKDFVAGGQTANDLVLYKSTLTSAGSIYEPLWRGPFAPHAPLT